MAKYTIAVKASAQRELDNLNHALFLRVDRRILSLAETPKPFGCRKLRGYKDLRQLLPVALGVTSHSVSDYRVVHCLDHASAIVTIMRVAHRKEAYDA